MVFRIVNTLFAIVIVVALVAASIKLGRQIREGRQPETAEQRRIAALTIASAKARDAAINKRWQRVDDFENTEWW